ncbi:MAG: hypothetical protein IJU45_05490 [Clostridia bacterium]|nr:hypothetical protein [Clostridia bacterium]
MKEIGGYIEIDTYNLPMLHEGAIALNCGRNALAYLLRARKIKRLRIPKYICDSVTGVCDREGVPYSLYGIGMDFAPSDEINLAEGEWLYFVNYYSQFDNEQIAEYVKKYKRVIVDNAQSYFQMPLPHVDTIYTCRKYFGVADGAFLYTDVKLDEVFPQDESFDRMRFLLGRFERTASEFYAEYSKNNDFFISEPIKQMSKLTYNLLHGVDYDLIKSAREDNYAFLYKKYEKVNGLQLSSHKGTFMYPLFVKNGTEIRKRLQKKKIYIPTLWPEISERYSVEYSLATDILPLPIDQRYDLNAMEYMVEEIEQCMKN